ncbi:MAG: hypothetical protein MHMPM18_002446 [Marteilia pararefringens]
MPILEPEFICGYLKFHLKYFKSRSQLAMDVFKLNLRNQNKRNTLGPLKSIKTYLTHLKKAYTLQEVEHSTDLICFDNILESYLKKGEIEIIFEIKFTNSPLIYARYALGSLYSDFDGTEPYIANQELSLFRNVSYITLCRKHFAFVNSSGFVLQIVPEIFAVPIDDQYKGHILFTMSLQKGTEYGILSLERIKLVYLQSTTMKGIQEVFLEISMGLIDSKEDKKKSRTDRVEVAKIVEFSDKITLDFEIFKFDQMAIHIGIYGKEKLSMKENLLGSMMLTRRCHEYIWFDFFSNPDKPCNFCCDLTDIIDSAPPSDT